MFNQDGIIGLLRIAFTLLVAGVLISAIPAAMHGKISKIAIQVAGILFIGVFFVLAVTDQLVPFLTTALNFFWPAGAKA